jgi:hypothetical protein
MKITITALAAAALAAGAVSTALAAAPICLQPTLIDHTHVQDASTILFYMKNGEVYANKLPAPCPGLYLHGFEWAIRGGMNEVCSKQNGISVLVTHQVCAIGEFTPYTPPAKVPANKS